MLRGQTQGASSPNQSLLPDLAQEIPAIHHAASRQFSLQGAPVHTQDTRRFREVAASGAQCAEDLFPFELDQTSSIPQLRIEADRDRAKAYGIAPGHLNVSRLVTRTRGRRGWGIPTRRG